MVIPKPPAILIPPLSIASPDETIARRTRSRFPTVDRPPPWANKTIDTDPIARRTRSQTAATASVFTPAQASQRRYPVKFLQIIAMTVLDETSRQSLQYRQLRKHPKFAHTWNTSYDNELGSLCQGIGQGSKGPKHQRVEGKKPSASSSFWISPKTDDKKFATPWLSTRSNLTRKIQIARASPSLVVKFDTPGI